jgi:hypothetical protein
VGIVPAYKNRKVRFATRSGRGDRLRSLARRTRINLALTLPAIAVVVVILLGAAGALMLSHRREY